MDVEVLLGKLPEKQAILLRMVKLEELSIRETASKTGYSESDVKVSIHRAMATLRSMVEAMLEDGHES